VSEMLFKQQPPGEDSGLNFSARGSAAIEDLQNRLQRHLGTHVTLHHGEKRGRIEIEYYGSDDLQRILTALGVNASES